MPLDKPQAPQPDTEAPERRRGSGVRVVYDILRDEILELRLAPGSPIDEVRLAERFGMSRTPIREALVRLAGEGLIDTLPNRAAFETDEETMYYVAYNGSFGENACNPITLNSGLLNRMVCLEGIVTRCSLVRPKVVKSVHWNENKGMFHFREYRDQTMSVGKPGSLSVYPQKDDEDNPVSLHAQSRRQQ